MPSISFPGAATSASDLFAKSVEKLAAAQITGWGPAVTFLANGSFAYEFNGSGLTYTLVGGLRVLTGGVISTVTVYVGGLAAMTLSGLGLGAAALQTAMTADATGTNNAAIEAVFLPLGWTYAGRDGRDDLMSAGVSSDGALLDLAGNDAVSLGGGNDACALGSGDDTGFGGSGQDWLDGGRGRDSLRGDSGNDTLLGGTGADRLDAGTGNDSLDGGSEGDQITGGKGRDTMTGGSGADTFVFALRDGQDQIVDFDIASDRIDLASGVSHAFTASGADLILTYGKSGDHILLIGIDITDSAAITLI